MSIVTQKIVRYFYFIHFTLKSKGKDTNMKKQLSPWSKKVKIAMIERDMDTQDVADKLCWSRQYTSSIINGRAYQKESVNKISELFNITIPSEKSTLAVIKEV